VTTNLLKVDVSAVEAVVDGIEQQLIANTRPAAQAGAEVLYQAVERNVAALGRKTGNLAASIYQAFSKDNSRPVAGGGYQSATYHVSWNARKAPHGHLVEFGHFQRFKVYVGKDGRWYTNKSAPLPEPVQVGARPFIRPAMSEFPRAEAAMRERLLQGVA
jgi:hypothetical protein